MCVGSLEYFLSLQSDSHREAWSSLIILLVTRLLKMHDDRVSSSLQSLIIFEYQKSAYIWLSDKVPELGENANSKLLTEVIKGTWVKVNCSIKRSFLFILPYFFIIHFRIIVFSNPSITTNYVLPLCTVPSACVPLLPSDVWDDELRPQAWAACNSPQVLHSHRRQVWHHTCWHKNQLTWTANRETNNYMNVVLLKWQEYCAIGCFLAQM